MSELDTGQARHDDVMTHVARPAYRRFCQCHDLPFHFWDELPKAEFDAGIAVAEDELHREALMLFNRIGPTRALHRNQIVKFRFGPAWINLDHLESQDIGAFLVEVEANEIQVSVFRDRLGVFAGVTAILLWLALTFAAAIALPPTLVFLAAIVSAAISLGFSSWFERRLTEVPSPAQRAIHKDQI